MEEFRNLFRDKNRLLSSAKILGSRIWKSLQRSFPYNVKSNGPEMDPCGAPHPLFGLAVFNELGNPPTLKVEFRNGVSSI